MVTPGLPFAAPTIFNRPTSSRRGYNLDIPARVPDRESAPWASEPRLSPTASMTAH